MTHSELESSGVTRSQLAIVSEIDFSDLRDPEKSWREVCQRLAVDFPSPQAARAIWDLLFKNWDTNQRPKPLWSPNLQQIHETNIATWSAELGIRDFAEFYRWSIGHRREFWSAAIGKLNIKFERMGEPFLTSDRGDQATWLPAAQLNIAKSCFLADPDATAILAQRPGESIRAITYHELKLQANRISNGLFEHGFRPGDAIAVVLPMTAESVAIYLGIVQAGMAVVSIADSFAAAEITSRLRIADAKAVFTYDQMLRAGKPIDLYRRVAEATELPIVSIPLDHDRPGNAIRNQDVAYSDLVSVQSQFEPVICNSNDPINILFSSGTTGDPKAIPWTHLTPIKCAIDGFIHQDMGPSTVAAWPTNLGWMMGPWLIFATLINRGSIALYEDVPMGDGFGKFVQHAGVTMLGVVPTIVKAWRSSRCMEPFDWSGIRCFSSTGEASQEGDMFYLSSLANIKPVIEYCGGTEIGGGYMTSTMVQPNVASAFSTPAIGLGIEILDPRGQPSEEGELFLIGPSIGLSETLLNRDHHETYYASAPILSDGTQLRKHGDFVKRLPGNYFVAGGRADDTMNLGGIKVSSAEIERVLNRIPEIKETAAIAFSDGGPDQLVVFMVLDETADGSRNPDDLKAEMNQQLKGSLNPLFKVARAETIDSMPRTASNKVMRRVLRARLTQPGG